MVAIPLDKINHNKVFKYANVLIFKEFYPKTKNVSYYLNHDTIVVPGTFHDSVLRNAYHGPTPSSGSASEQKTQMDK